MPEKKAGIGIGIGKRIRLAHMAFSRALRVELAKSDVTFGQFVHLEQLWKSDGMTQVELSRRVGVETASSTSILEQLETQGLIDRKRNADDRRKISVYLTPKGAALEGPLLASAKKVNKAARRSLSENDLLHLFEVLDILTASLTEQYPASSSTDARTRLNS